MNLTEPPAVPLREWEDLRQQLGRIVRQHTALLAALDALAVEMREYQFCGVISHREAAVRADERGHWANRLSAALEKHR
jgi:hypothetical protein